MSQDPLMMVTTLLPIRTVRHEALVYMVGSAGNPGDSYRVDLTAYRFNGECGCINFQVKLKPKLEGGSRPSDLTRCKHIRAARSFLADRCIAKIVEFDSDTDPQKWLLDFVEHVTNGNRSPKRTASPRAHKQT